MTVIAVLNWIGGGLALLGGISGLVSGNSTTDYPFLDAAQSSAWIGGLLRWSYVLSIGIGVVAIVSGIGLLEVARWGKGWTRAYAVLGLLSTIGGVLLTLALAQGKAGLERNLYLFGSVMGGLLGCAYPIVLFMFLRSAKWNAAFASVRPKPSRKVLSLRALGAVGLFAALLLFRFILSYSLNGPFNRGLEFSRKGEYDKAIAAYTEAIRLNPRNSDAYVNRGVVYAKKRDYDKAIADYNEAIRLSPTDADAYNNRGTAYHRKGDYEKSIADITEAIRLKPSASSYYNRADTYDDKGDYDKAIADYTEAIRLGPADADCYNNRGVAYQHKGDYPKAIADYTEAIRLNPASSGYNNRGVAYQLVNEYDKAIADFTESIRINPKKAKTYLNRAEAYDKKGESAKATADRDEAARLEPKTPAP